MIVARIKNIEVTDKTVGNWTHLNCKLALFKTVRSEIGVRQSPKDQPNYKVIINSEEV